MSGGPEVRQQLAQALRLRGFRPSGELADLIVPLIDRIAAERAAEALGEALSISATRGPLEAVAWMARRHAEAMAAGRQETT